MAVGSGTVTINFGAFPGTQEASIPFTDATISAGSKVEAFVMASDSVGDHTANDHKYLPLFAAFTGEPIAGVGGTIYGRALYSLIGEYKLRYAWAD